MPRLINNSCYILFFFRVTKNETIFGTMRFQPLECRRFIEIGIEHLVTRRYDIRSKTEFMFARSGISVYRLRLFCRLLISQGRITVHQNFNSVFVKFLLRLIRSESGAKLQSDSVSLCCGYHIAHGLGTAAVHNITALNFFKRYALNIAVGNGMRRIDEHQRFERVIFRFNSRIRFGFCV